MFCLCDVPCFFFFLFIRSFFGFVCLMFVVFGFVCSLLFLFLCFVLCFDVCCFCFVLCFVVLFVCMIIVLYFCFVFFAQKTFKDEELLPLQLVLKKLDLISELRER